jgi:hypothetical protein
LKQENKSENLRDLIANSIKQNFPSNDIFQFKQLLEEALVKVINDLESGIGSKNEDKNHSRNIKLNIGADSHKQVHTQNKQVSNELKSTKVVNRLHKGLLYESQHQNKEQIIKKCRSPNEKKKEANVSLKAQPENKSKNDQLINNKCEKNYLFNPSLKGYLNKHLKDKEKQSIERVENPRYLIGSQLNKCQIKKRKSEEKESKQIKSYIENSTNPKYSINPTNFNTKKIDCGKKRADKNISSDQTHVNSSRRVEHSNQQSNDYLREVKLNIEENLKNLLNFSYENFLQKEKENSESSRRSMSKSNLNISNPNSLNNDFSSINQPRKEIQLTGSIQLDNVDENLRNQVFRKINN